MVRIKPIKIGKRWIGENHSCYIIAEIGSNFDGDLTKAKELIKTAKKCGANAAKFQSFQTEELLSLKGFERKSEFQSKWKKSVWQVYKDAELPLSWHKELNNYSKKIGIHFFTSPWSMESVELLKKINVPAVKVGSGDITHIQILKKIGRIGKPVILATGASNLKEIHDAVKAIQSTGNKKIILMQSVTQYPSPIEEANLKVLNTLRIKFKLNVGYSDHSPGSLVPLASVALGASVIEKHFSLDPKSKGPDHPHSMSPKTFAKMVLDIRTLEKALGDGQKRVEKSEKKARIIQRRGIWTIKKIRKGEKFNASNIKALRPVKGKSVAKYKEMLGKKATKNFQPYESL